MKKQVAGLFALCLMSVASASAADFPKAYDAQYDRSGPQGQAAYRMCSDGQGHMRIDSEAPAMKKNSVTIFDYLKKKAYVLLDVQKMAMVMDLNPDQVAGADTETRMKRLGATSLGTKVIGGHPCHGWTYTANDTKHETWSGDDTGCLVRSVTSGPQGEETVELKSFSAAAPAASVFVVPSGYKLTSMAAMGAAGMGAAAR